MPGREYNTNRNNMFHQCCHGVLACCCSYRLAPEAVFPDQYHDALAAARAFLSAQVLQEHSIDPERVCVSGDSAGGNLAAAVAQQVNQPKKI